MVNIFMQDGWTPLIMASFNGHADVVHVLVRANADVNLRTKVRLGTNTYVKIVWHFLLFRLHSTLFCLPFVLTENIPPVITFSVLRTLLKLQLLSLLYCRIISQLSTLPQWKAT